MNQSIKQQIKPLSENQAGKLFNDKTSSINAKQQIYQQICQQSNYQIVRQLTIFFAHSPIK